MEQVIKKRRKKRDNLLYIDFACLESNQERRSEDDIKQKIISLFRNHIGKENAITPYELFYSVYGINPQLISIFEREFFWNVIKRISRELRKSETCFIVNKGNKLFVLKSEEELESYKKSIDRHVEDLKNVKIKAIRWVKNKKWKNL